MRFKNFVYLSYSKREKKILEAFWHYPQVQEIPNFVTITMDNTKTLHGLFIFAIQNENVFIIGVGLYVLLGYQVWGYFWTGNAKVPHASPFIITAFGGNKLTIGLYMKAFHVVDRDSFRNQIFLFYYFFLFCIVMHLWCKIYAILLFSYRR